MTDIVLSPLAPAQLADLPPLLGVNLAVGAAGIRYHDRPDLLLVVLDPGTSVAGCVTRSLTRSAPVDWCVEALKGGKARALIVNSGNANAFTGKIGDKTVKAVAKAASRLMITQENQIFQASTGVIGEPLLADYITKILPELIQNLRPDLWAEAARAIMTTDSFPKLATMSVMLEGKKITLNAIAKGSGMIAPDMATMLAFVFTDAAIPAAILRKLLKASVEKSFNAISVDSDTSTSDTVLLFATGAAGQTRRPLKSHEDTRLKPFKQALDDICLDLAQQIVKDGEGAEKFIEITISGAQNDHAARRIAFSVANSPLVKTAIAGEDANWGRIVMAIGKSGEKAVRDKLRISIGGIQLAKAGQRDPHYCEADLLPHMKGRNIKIAADVGVGRGKATVWTCDLTHRYIDINGSYRS